MTSTLLNAAGYPRMIGKLRGRIDSHGPDWVMIDVGGVCYHVFCSGKTLAALPPPASSPKSIPTCSFRRT